MSATALPFSISGRRSPRARRRRLRATLPSSSPIWERRIEVLILENLHVSYDGSAALRGVDLTVPQGEMVAIIGPNGAGKTTLLRTISGLVRRTDGGMSFQGSDLGALRPDQIVRLGVVHVPEGRM